MNQPQLIAVLRAAIAEQVLPATASAPHQETRPWPVVLLTALGAWLAALPLLGVVGLLLGDVIGRSFGPYLIGTLVLGAAIVVLRSREVPLFLEQLAVAALLVGGGSLGFGLFRDLHAYTGAAVLALVALGVAAAIARPWLRVLLGATAAALMVVAWMPERWTGSFQTLSTRFWFAWHVAMALWLVAGWMQHKVLTDGAQARAAATLESLAAGWLLATLAGLAWW